jgi:hypothetical protein
LIILWFSLSAADLFLSFQKGAFMKQEFTISLTSKIAAL